MGYPTAMFRVSIAVAHALRALFRSRFEIAIENAALRQQLAVMKQSRGRPRLRGSDRLFWVLLRRVWSGWTGTLIIVKPETVIRWHRAGFRTYWRWKSRRAGRPRSDREIRELIRRMAAQNSWGAPRILILDRDGKYGRVVPEQLKSWGVKLVRTAWRSPWQNGVAERWIASVRREALDHAIVFNETHLRRLLDDYVGYYNQDRCHLALEKDAPEPREAQPRPTASAKVVALPRVGGIHHRYEWNAPSRFAA